MKGDFTRFTHDPDKQYNRVLKQQGRVALDADWNEQVDIHTDLERTEAIDVIGDCGVPRDADGFEIGVGPDEEAEWGEAVTIASGRIYVDGILCRNPGASGDGDDGRPLPIAEQPHLPTFAPPVPEDGMATYVAYLDVWERHVTALDDEAIKEIALGGPDTTTRVQTVWQVKLAPFAPGEEGEGTVPADVEAAETECPGADWRPPDVGGMPRMKAWADPAEVDESLCDSPRSGGFRGIENRLYRVEIHEEGVDDRPPTFKWSRDNGAVVYAVESVDEDGDQLTLEHPGRDQTLAVRPGDWVEVTWEARELRGEPGLFRRVTAPAGDASQPSRSSREVTLEHSIFNGEISSKAAADARRLRIRRWDHRGVDEGLLRVTEGEAIHLEKGVYIQFDDENASYSTGDYWTIPARTVTEDVLWPVRTTGGETEPAFCVREGIEHHYCPLALVDIRADGDTPRFRVREDCRPMFPSLTTIGAGDVSYDNTACQPELAEADTVQEALDALCHNRHNSCTLVAVPGPGWETVFDLVAPGDDAQICFQAGEYPLESPKRIENKGHITIKGCGAGTRITAPDSEAALVFDGCASATVKDIYAETGYVGAGGAHPGAGLNGTITFRDCGAVNVGDAVFKCGAGATHGANCLTIYGNPDDPRPVRVQQCHLEVGHHQGGILVVDAGRTHVEDNVVEVYEKPGSLTLSRQLENLEARARMRPVLLSSGVSEPSREHSEIDLSFGGQATRITSHKYLRTSDWQSLLETGVSAGELAGEKELSDETRRMADRILVDPEFRGRFERFADLFGTLERLDRAVARKGITVGGETAGEVRILNNTVDGMLQGIHVGLSHEGAARSEHDLAGTVNIRDNAIDVLLPPDTGNLGRHGIFVGNCRSLLVENNHVQLERIVERKKLEYANTLEIDGIRIWGVLGDRAMIVHNHLTASSGNDGQSFDVGVHVHPLADTKPETSLWHVMWNVAPSKQMTVRVDSDLVSAANNTPG